MLHTPVLFEHSLTPTPVMCLALTAQHQCKATNTNHHLFLTKTTTKQLKHLDLCDLWNFSWNLFT